MWAVLNKDERCGARPPVGLNQRRCERAGKKPRAHSNGAYRH
jgi:hypothetical protein